MKSSETSERARTKPLRRFAASAMPRVVGYCLLVLFSFDLVEILMNYRAAAPQSDAVLVAQVIERVAVPLLAYALVFLLEAENLGRFELLVRKVLSFASLAWMAASLALSVLAVTTGIRLIRTSGATYQRQLVEHTALLSGVKKNLPRLSDGQVAVIYGELIGRQQSGVPVAGRDPGQMRSAIDEAIPGFIDSETSLLNSARRQSRRQIAMSSAKYALGGFVSAIAFLFIWEATYKARTARVFGYRHGPSMVVEDRVATWFGRMIAGASEFSPLPNFEDYRWYRRIKRAYRHWRESRRS